MRLKRVLFETIISRQCRKIKARVLLMWIRKTNEVFGMLSLCVEAFTDSDAEADVNQKWFHNMSMRYDLKSMKQKARATSWNSWSVVS